MLIYLGARWMNPAREDIKLIDTSEVIEYLDDDSVKEFNRSTDGNTTIKLKDDTLFKAYISAESYSDLISSGTLNPRVVPVSEQKPADTGFLSDIISMVLMLGLFGVFWFFIMRNMQGGNNKAMSFGKSTAKVHQDEKDPVLFNDVAGLKEEKEELAEIVDFLKSPRKYNALGARIPAGVLLVGPPGTGKTYLSRAVAGEAKVPFFSISGSEFVEMFVGVGASRIRDLFDQAKKNAPCIIFIDEIDAVGRRRGAGMGGGHDEREQTLNQLLVEMDGFSKNEGIIIMAATNRADILDPALLRPGRFDRTVYVGKPDVVGREEILQVHTRNKPLEGNVNLRTVARRTPGFTPADLENLVNEAALLSARQNKSTINMDNIEEASIKVQAGPAKKSRVVSEKERRLTAVHEAGHALVSRLTPESDPVHMITIIPRGGAGGFTAFIPEDDVNFMTKSQMEAELISLLGGRVAESLVLDDISTGASNDIERATQMARAMVTHYGMSSKLGPINYGTDDDNVFMGKDFGRTRNYSEEIAAEIDKEMKSLIDSAYNKAEELIRENLEILLRISDVLLDRETLNAEEFEIVFNGGVLPEIDDSKEVVNTPIEEVMTEKAKEILQEDLNVENEDIEME
ncbi:MAG: ATP-dependent zinc metalloprotease FtsH [Tissierellia bacterium]|nr:ATP-dependent zinc metalloprotease FtsH [Tissierellia bacterium]